MRSTRKSEACVLQTSIEWPDCIVGSGRPGLGLPGRSSSLDRLPRAKNTHTVHLADHFKADQQAAEVAAFLHPRGIKEGQQASVSLDGAQRAVFDDMLGTIRYF